MNGLLIVIACVVVLVLCGIGLYADRVARKHYRGPGSKGRTP